MLFLSVLCLFIRIRPSFSQFALRIYPLGIVRSVLKTAGNRDKNLGLIVCSTTLTAFWT